MTTNQQQGILALDVRFLVSLTPEDFRTVSRALLAAGGVRPFPDDGEAKEAARSLQDRLHQARQAQVASWASTIAPKGPPPEDDGPPAPSGPRAPSAMWCPHCGRQSAGPDTNLCRDALAGRDCTHAPGARVTTTKGGGR